MKQYATSKFTEAYQQLNLNDSEITDWWDRQFS